MQVEDTKLMEASNDGLEEKEIDILIEPKDGLDIRQVPCFLGLNITVQRKIIDRIIIPDP